AQRLGVQTRATRVVTKDGVQSVELFHTPSLQFRDHEYKSMRKLDLKGLPVSGGAITPSPKQLLLIARVTFTRYAGDSDHWVRFSPASARLVAPAPGGEEMMNYYPIGTVEGAETLDLGKPDDFLFGKDDGGVDLAYLVDRAGFLSGTGQGATLKVAPETFLEFKRMAREDLGGHTISANYKPVENIKVERKKAPEGEMPAEPSAPSPAPAPAPA